MQPKPLRRSLNLLLSFALVLSQLMLLTGSVALAAPSVTVNSTGDLGDLTPGDGICHTGAVNSASDPECTLRAAIEEANASSVDEIAFDIPNNDPGFGAGSWVIEPITAIPWITQPVSIDATTQSGFAGSPVVVLDGSLAAASPGGTDGLLLDTNGATIRGFVVRDFEDDGIEIHGNYNTVVGNYIFDNDDGVLVENASYNDIGGVSSADRNVISGNNADGVSLNGSIGTDVVGNYIGLNAAGSAALPNLLYGVTIEAGASSSELEGNVVSGNTAGGVHISDSVFARVHDTIIGLDPGGSTAIPNTGHGVLIDEAAAQPDVGPDNVISGNSGSGLSIGASAIPDVIGNYIGLNQAGTGAIGNGAYGIEIDDVDASIPRVTGGNVISGNTLSGVRINDSFAARIQGSIIGLDAGGSTAVPNGGHGISIGPLAGAPYIGGTVAGQGNVISGNTTNGIDIEYGAFATGIYNNRIGTDSTGSSAAANGGDGIRADADSVSVIDNQVSGNTVDGLRLERFNALVQGNLIGTDATGASPVPNGDDGIDTGSGTSGTDIGGLSPGDGNIIAFNSDAGIALRGVSGTTAAIVSNSIFGNGSIGIDLLDDGPTANDIGDGDTGPPNSLINYPVITQSATAGPDVYVDFDLDVPAGWHRIEFFLNPSGADPSGFGEGETFASSVVINHPGTGSTSFSHVFPGSPGVDLTATTTRCTSSSCSSFVETSEFSAASSIVVGNNEPVLDPISDEVVDEGSPVSFTATATDPDLGDSLTFSLSGQPAGASINPTSGVFAWTPTENQGPGGHTFDVVVTDDGTPANLSDSQPVTVTVNEVNVAPDLVDPGDQTVDEQTTLSFTAAATDADFPANALTYSLTGAPSGASINPTSGVFSWTPTEAQAPGIYTFDIVVTDNGSPTLDDTESIKVTVNEVNVAPVVTDPGDQTNAEADGVNLAITASDADIPANALTYSSTGLPPGLTVAPNTGVISGTIQYNGSDSSPYTTIVTASDNGTPNLAGQTTFTWIVTNTNRPPVLEPVDDQTIDEQTTLNFTATGTDPDSGDILTYHLDGEPPGAVMDPNTGVFTWTPTESQGAGGYTFDVVVSDNGSPSLEDAETVTITVNEVNLPPTLGSVANATIDEEKTLAFTVTASDPDPADKLTFSISGAPKGASISPTSGLFRWTPTEAQGPGTYIFTITVTDSGSPTLSDSRTVTIVVSEVNHPPVAVNDTTTTSEDVPVVIDVLANDSDDDGHELTITSLGSSAEGLTIPMANGKIKFDPWPNFHGIASFTYTISDGYATDTGIVTVDVGSVNDFPVAVDDRYRLGNYRPAVLPVLSNDFDPDGDALGLTLGSAPVIGSVSIEGDHFVYKPDNGWTGSVVFTYSVRDPRGASSQATVEIIVGDEVLIGARDLAEELGAGRLPFKPPQPALPEGVTLINLDGISLLTDSFFQTVDSLRIPLGFLGLTVAMVVGLGTATEVPALVVGTRRRHWAVVRLGRSQRLPAYSEPGGRKVVYNYDPTAAGIVSLGKTRTVGNTEWLPVDTPNGKAWIYRKYLTEHVDLEAFTEDSRPIRLVHELARRLRRGASLGNLISHEGLIVALTGPPSQIAPDQLSSLMDGDRLRHLPNIGKAPSTPAEFNVAVATPFLEAYQTTPEITPDRAHSSSALIPTECWNFPYMAIGSADGVQPWLVFFEYRKGRAWIAGIGIDE